MVSGTVSTVYRYWILNGAPLSRKIEFGGVVVPKSVVNRVCGALFVAGLSMHVATATNYYSVGWGASRFPEGHVDVLGYITPGREVHARVGMFGLRASGADGNGPWDFMAVCVDPREWLFAAGSPQLYAVEDLSVYTLIPNAIGAATAAIALSPQRKSLLEQLYFVAGAAAISGNNVSSAAFQEAVWEIVGETLDSDPYNGDLSLSSGAVRITGSGDDVSVRNQANAYLGMLNASSAATRLRIWSPVREVRNYLGQVTGYERIVGQELLTPVPEPALYAVLALGLLGIFGLTRRSAAVPPVS